MNGSNQWDLELNGGGYNENNINFWYLIKFYTKLAVIGFFLSFAKIKSSGTRATHKVSSFKDKIFLKNMILLSLSLSWCRSWFLIHFKFGRKKSQEKTVKHTNQQTRERERAISFLKNLSRKLQSEQATHYPILGLLHTGSLCIESH